MRSILMWLIWLSLASPILADTFVVQGYIANPSGPDSSPGIYGYDNGGYFGAQFSSLGGLSFSVIWSGDPCGCYGGPMVSGNPTSPISGATLAVGDVTIDLLAYGGIAQSEWLANGLQVKTVSSITETLASPPFTTATAYFGSSNILTTWSENSKDSGHGGMVYLSDVNHQFQTSAYLIITDWNGVPVQGVSGPVLGGGLPGLFVVCGALGIVAWWRRRFGRALWVISNLSWRAAPARNAFALTVLPIG